MAGTPAGSRQSALLPLLALWQFYPMIRDLELVRDEPAVAAAFYESIERTLGPRLAAQPGPGRGPAGGQPLGVGAGSHRRYRWPAAGSARRTGASTASSTATGSTPIATGAGFEGSRSATSPFPRTELDYAAETEAELIERGVDFLREIPSGSDWKLYRVLGATPMVERPARMTVSGGRRLQRSTFRGRALIGCGSGATPYWQVVEGTGCVGQDGGRVDQGQHQTGRVTSRSGPGSARERVSATTRTAARSGPPLPISSKLREWSRLRRVRPTVEATVLATDRPRSSAARPATA